MDKYFVGSWDEFALRFGKDLANIEGEIRDEARAAGARYEVEMEAKVA